MSDAPDGTTLEPLARKVDCIRLYVADLDQGLAFYRDRLGHALIWRTPEAAGLRLPADGSEIVLHTKQMPLEVDLQVESADAAAARFQGAGGEVVLPPFDIRIGRAAVVQDPWGNRLVLLDSSKGHLITDAEGCVTGVGETHVAQSYDELYEEALRLAACTHKTQTRKGTDLPYITHLVHVSAILERYGFSREPVIAALLHDAVEDQDLDVEDIKAQFGSQVAEIVDAMSERRNDADGQKRPWHIRKDEAVEKIRLASTAAAAVKAADVLHNVQSILYDLRHEGTDVWDRFTREPEAMLGYYGRISEIAQAKLGSHALVKELLAAIDEFKSVVESAGDVTRVQGET